MGLVRLSYRFALAAVGGDTHSLPVGVKVSRVYVVHRIGRPNLFIVTHPCPGKPRETRSLVVVAVQGAPLPATNHSQSRSPSRSFRGPEGVSQGRSQVNSTLRGKHASLAWVFVQTWTRTSLEQTSCCSNTPPPQKSLLQAHLLLIPVMDALPEMLCTRLGVEVGLRGL